MRPLYLYEQGAAMLLTVGVAWAQLAVTATQVDQWSDTPGWWNVAVLAGTAAVLALGVLAAAGRAAGRWVALAHVGVTTAALLTLPHLSSATYTTTEPPWVSSFALTAAAGSVLVSPTWWLATLSALAVVLARLLAQRWGAWTVPESYQFADAGTGLVLFAMCLAVVTALRALDRGVREEALTAAASYARARVTEQVARHEAQWDALVHDRVLAALESVVQSAPAGAAVDDVRDREARARAACGAAAASLDAGPSGWQPDARRFQDELLQTVLAVCPMAATVFPPLEGDEDRVPVPRAVAQALLMAVSEALRNAVTHAYPEGDEGPVVVELAHTDSDVAVTVRDQGVGFRRGDVGVTSFGLTLSIEQRMDLVGGRGAVHSSPGQGTTVAIRWPSRGHR